MFHFLQNALLLHSENETDFHSLTAGLSDQTLQVEASAELQQSYVLTKVGSQIQCPAEPWPCIDLSELQSQPHLLVIGQDGAVTSSSLITPIALDRRRQRPFAEPWTA